jgi:hypothetical protein
MALTEAGMGADSSSRKIEHVYAALAAVCFGGFLVASIISDGAPVGTGLFIVIGTAFAATAGNYWYKPPAQRPERDRR